RRERSIIGSVGFGTSTYFGELANPGDYLDTKPSVNIGLQYFFTNRISLRSELTWFQLHGDDAKADDTGRRNRNLSFTASTWEFNATGSISFASMGTRYHQRPRINVYGYAGVSEPSSNPKPYLNAKKHELQRRETEGVEYN